jgi:hypothetical protein
MRDWFQADLFKDVMATVRIKEVTIRNHGYYAPSLNQLVLGDKQPPPENLFVRMVFLFEPATPLVALDLEKALYSRTNGRPHTTIDRYYIITDLTLETVIADNRPAGYLANSTATNLVKFIKEKKQLVNVIMSLKMDPQLTRTHPFNNILAYHVDVPLKCQK